MAGAEPQLPADSESYADKKKKIDLIYMSEDLLKKNYEAFLKKNPLPPDQKEIDIEKRMIHFKDKIDSMEATAPPAELDEVIVAFEGWIKKVFQSSLSLNDLEKQMELEKRKNVSKEAEKRKDTKVTHENDKLLSKIVSEIEKLEDKQQQMDQSKLDKLTLLFACRDCLLGNRSVDSLKTVKEEIDNKSKDNKPVSKEPEQYERLYSQVLASQNKPAKANNQFSFKTISNTISNIFKKP